MSVLGVEFDRTLVLLNDENRFVRKKALNDIGSYLSTKSGYLNYVYNERSLLPLTELAQSLSSTLNDNIEVNRELAVKINHMLLDLTPDICNVASSLIPVLVKRLGQKEVVEPSEELRLDTLRLVQVMSEKMSDITPFVDELLTIIQHSLMDSYHEVKKLSCNIAQELAQKGGERFYRTSECLINPLLANLIHQHSKVRVAAIQAIGTVLVHSQSKLVDQTILPLTQRLFDPACAVRRSVVEIDIHITQAFFRSFLLGCWMIPLKYVSLRRASGTTLFEKENEEQLKDKLDFQTGPPYYYPLGCLQPTFEYSHITVKL
ncbi:unnamed protein product [Dicrocoelium dendriticum]|nr:unnamed protein product [Dicrocoelium dendriticum]